MVLDALTSCGVQVVGIFDHRQTGELMRVPYLGSYDSGIFSDALLIISIGNNQTRYMLAKDIRHAFGRVIHNTARVANGAEIQAGAMILHGSIIQTASVIENHAIINSGAIVEHDCRVCRFAHVAPGAILCGNAEVGEGALIGAGSVILPGISVGEWSVIGSGSVVTRSIPASVVAFGNPARVVKQLRHEKK